MQADQVDQPTIRNNQHKNTYNRWDENRFISAIVLINTAQRVWADYNAEGKEYTKSNNEGIEL